MRSTRTATVRARRAGSSCAMHLHTTAQVPLQQAVCGARKLPKGAAAAVPGAGKLTAADAQIHWQRLNSVLKARSCESI